jgi:hypothetical protein
LGLDFQFPTPHIRRLEVATPPCKKLTRLKKINNTFYICKRGEDIGQIAAPKIGETGESWES